VQETLARARLPSDDDSVWHDQWRDKLVRWFEDRHQQKSEGLPSPEAIDEAVEYYSGIHQGKEHDPVAFRRLLRRRGLPDWSNPYPVGPERVLLHEDGFLWADVQVLVNDLVSRATAPASSAEIGEVLKIHHAQICWMMILQETGGRWPRSLSAIHPDNLVAITLEAMLNTHLGMWDLDPGRWETPDLLG
jgi:hypothetical protein